MNDETMKVSEVGTTVRNTANNIGEKLKALADKAAEEQALIFASNLEEKLEELAESGERQLFLSIDEKNEKWVQSEHFLKTLESLLEGVQVEVVSKSPIFFSHIKYKELKFSW